MTLKDYIIIFVGSTGLIWYYVSLVTLGLTPTDPQTPTTTFRHFMSLSVTTIGSSLATFVGMLLGLKTVSGNFEGALYTASTSEATGSVQKVQDVVNTALSHSLQWWAAGLYVLSMIVALIFWFRVGDKVDSSISNLGKSIIGLIAGALAIALNL